MNNAIRGALLVALALIVTGCAGARSGANDIKAEVVEPAPDAGFIEQPERQTKRGDLPFQKVWMKPGMDWNQYQELIVSPVDTQHVHKMDWLHSMTSANWIGDVKQDIEELAQYFHGQVVKKFKEDPQHRFEVIEQPAQHQRRALRLELALIEIDPSQPVLHALAWAGPPGTGTAAARSTSAGPLSRGGCAICKPVKRLRPSRIAICRMPGLSTSLV